MLTFIFISNHFGRANTFGTIGKHYHITCTARGKICKLWNMKI